MLNTKLFDVPVFVSSVDGNAGGAVYMVAVEKLQALEVPAPKPTDLAIAEDKHQNCWGTWRMQANKNKSLYAHHRISIAC